MTARHDTNDVTEMWREVRSEQQDRRRARLPIRTAEILELEQAGFTVRALTDYQFRVNEAIDLYPTHRRYHNLKTGRRGTYRSALALVRDVLRVKAAS